MLKRGISSLESVFLEEYIMKQVNCPICNCKCIKHGKIKSGSQRWFCKSCKLAFTPKIDNDTKQLQQFLNWLFSKEVQSNMSGGGRTFRRKTSRFWDIWVMSPKIAEPKVVVSDGGTGFRKALKRKWPKAKHQRYGLIVLHVGL